MFGGTLFNGLLAILTGVLGAFTGLLGPLDASRRSRVAFLIMVFAGNFFAFLITVPLVSVMIVVRPSTFLGFKVEGLPAAGLA